MSQSHDFPLGWPGFTSSQWQRCHCRRVGVDKVWLFQHCHWALYWKTLLKAVWLIPKIAFDPTVHRWFYLFLVLCLIVIVLYSFQVQYHEDKQRQAICLEVLWMDIVARGHFPFHTMLIMPLTTSLSLLHLHRITLHSIPISGKHNVCCKNEKSLSAVRGQWRETGGVRMKGKDWGCVEEGGRC